MSFLNKISFEEKDDSFKLIEAATLAMDRYIKNLNLESTSRDSLNSKSTRQNDISSKNCQINSESFLSLDKAMQAYLFHELSKNNDEINKLRTERDQLKNDLAISNKSFKAIIAMKNDQIKQLQSELNKVNVDKIAKDQIKERQSGKLSMTTNDDKNKNAHFVFSFSAPSKTARNKRSIND